MSALRDFPINIFQFQNSKLIPPGKNSVKYQGREDGREGWNAKVFSQDFFWTKTSLILCLIFSPYGSCLFDIGLPQTFSIAPGVVLGHDLRLPLFLRASKGIHSTMFLVHQPSVNLHTRPPQFHFKLLIVFTRYVIFVLFLISLFDILPVR